MLDSGIAIQKAFQLSADKTSDSRCAEAMRRIADAIGHGSEVSEAMRAQGQTFPDLMVEMVSVAEQTGTMPEILKGLAEHYDNNVRLRRNFIASITWPVVQFVAAVLIIAFLIMVLGWIGDRPGGVQLDVLGFGLMGFKGSIAWLTIVFGSLLTLFTAYHIAARSLSGKRTLDSVLMGIPAVGKCMRSFAIARFSWAFYLTQQTGMPIEQSLRSSLRATNNGAFVGAGDVICRKVNAGDELSAALRESRLFPADYLSMVEVAEVSGTVPEALQRLSPQFEEEARRSLAGLTAFLGWGIWAMVAAFIIFLIFRIAMWYVGMINDAVQQTY